MRADCRGGVFWGHEHVLERDRGKRLTPASAVNLTANCTSESHAEAVGISTERSRSRSRLHAPDREDRAGPREGPHTPSPCPPAA